MIMFYTHIFLVSIGYIISFILASFIGPKIANRLSGKISLYFSMILLPIVILSTFSLSISLAFYFLGIDLLYIFPLILIYSLFVNILIYIISPLIIDRSFSARKDENLQRIVDRVKEKLGYKGKINAVVVKGPPNAFAYGNIFFGKRVAVTESLMRILDENELEAVIGHEIGHHKHKDSLLMMLFNLLPTIIYYLGVIMIRSSIFSRYEKNRKFLFVIFGIFLVVISFLVQILIFAFSRLREYFADYIGSRASSKLSMQKALVKIYMYYNQYKGDNIVKIRDSPMRILFIYALANPFINVSEEDIERIKQNKESAPFEIFQTHPPIPKRLKFLDTIKQIF
ncbi:MAG: M48 family metalloprotease [Candidatus Aenigmatarchaeota archaeon]